MAIHHRLRDCFSALAMTVTLVPAACVQPNTQKRVDDQAELMSDAAEQRVSTQLAKLERRTSDQVAVKTVNSLRGQPIEAVSIATAREMRLGVKGKDNGVLVLVAPHEKKVRIETGCGMAGVLTDAEATQIVSVMVSEFRSGAFETGIERGVQQIEDELKQHPSGPLRLVRDARCKS